MRIDFDYLCRITANLSGIPVRVYRGEEGFPRKKAALMAAFLLGMTGWNAFCNSSFYIPNSLFPFSMARAVAVVSMTARWRLRTSS